ncbi:MAG: hypothetical protein NVS1B11_01700 [Terriglobales bacterium]
MKNIFTLCCLLLSGLAALQGQTSKPRVVSADYRLGTVLKIERGGGRSHTYSPGTNPTDEPLKSKIYTYEISVRVECGTYVVRYDSAVDYLPPTISANSRTKVRVAKHFLYFNVLGDQELKMPIVRRKTDQKDTCASSEVHS